MLADLLNVPRSPSDWERWGLSHSIVHQEIIAAISARGGPSLTPYQLYPFALDALGDFLERNQHAHSDINAYLGLTSTDLQEVDPGNHEQLVAWVQAHHQSHYQIASALEI